MKEFDHRTFCIRDHPNCPCPTCACDADDALCCCRDDRCRQCQDTQKCPFYIPESEVLHLDYLKTYSGADSYD